MAVAMEQGERLIPVPSPDMGNAMAGEQAVPKAADVDLVLDDQYGALGRRLGE